MRSKIVKEKERIRSYDSSCRSCSGERIRTRTKYPCEGGKRTHSIDFVTFSRGQNGQQPVWENLVMPNVLSSVIFSSTRRWILPAMTVGCTRIKTAKKINREYLGRCIFSPSKKYSLAHTTKTRNQLYCMSTFRSHITANHSCEIPRNATNVPTRIGDTI